MRNEVYSKIYFFSTFIFLFIYISLDIYFGKALYSWSNELAYNWQQASGPQATIIFTLPSYFVHRLIFAFVLINVWVFDHKKVRVIKYFTYITTSLFIPTFLKTIYTDPRPYMVLNHLKAQECEFDFGKPSGHAFYGFTFYVLTYSYLLEIFKSNQTKPSLFYSKNARALGWIITAILIFLIGGSRVFLGVHSIDQLLLGWIFGIFYCISIWTYFDGKYTEYLKYIIKKDWKGRNNFKQAVSQIFILIIMAFGIPTVIYLFQNQNIEYNESWLNNISNKCGNKGYNKILLAYNYKKCAVLMTTFGLLLGILFSKGRYDEENEYEKWCLKKRFLRPLVYYMIIILPALLLLIPIPIELLLVDYFILAIVVFFIGFNLAFIPPHAFYILKLECKGDFLKNISSIDIKNNRALEIEFNDFQLYYKSGLRNDQGQGQTESSRILLSIED